MQEINMNFKAVKFRHAQLSEKAVVPLRGRALKDLSPTTWQGT